MVNISRSNQSEGSRTTSVKETYKTMAYAIVVLFLLIICIQCLPNSWLRARSEGDSRGVDVAIILGFGYEEVENGKMKPGAANEFLLHWVLESFPEVRTILVQEGIWAAACETSAETCKIGSVGLLRIHRHDPSLDVNTFQTAVCAVKRMNELGKKRAILVAHHMQLWRTGKVFERVRHKLCEDCEFVIPNVPDTPYPNRSVQWRTRNEFIYRIVEVLARLRDSKLVTPEIPDECIAPLEEEQS